MCNTVYEGGPQGLHLRHAQQPERMPSIHGSPQLQPWWAAGYSFSRGHFVVNIPYDQYQPMIFQGEEMSIGLRGFTTGYDYYVSTLFAQDTGKFPRYSHSFVYLLNLLQAREYTVC